MARKAPDVVTVQRRFPVRDLVLHIAMRPTEAASRLERALRSQNRTSGLPLYETRVDGSTTMSSFVFRRRIAGFGRLSVVKIGGYFVPDGSTSLAYIRAEMDAWIWGGMATLFPVVTIALGITEGWFLGSGEALVALALGIVASYALLAFESRNGADFLRAALSDRAETSRLRS